MAKLVISLDGSSLGEFSLDKERTTIGRRPSNDIHLDNLAVSGDHAVIVTIAGESFLEDLNSTNGTMVNMKPIKKHVLQHADVIQFGKYQLRYENAAQKNPSAQHHGFENTVVMRPSKVDSATPKAQDDIKQDNMKADVAITAKMKQPPVAPTLVVKPAPVATGLSTQANAPRMGRVQILTGTNAGQELLLNKALTTFGESGVQVVVITKRPHGYFISHVEGDKRLLINGQKTGPQAHELVDHDVIDLVGMKMEFFLA